MYFLKKIISATQEDEHLWWTCMGMDYYLEKKPWTAYGWDRTWLWTTLQMLIRQVLSHNIWPLRMNWHRRSGLLLLCRRPVFRRSTRKFPSFSSCHFFISFPASRFFLYLQQILNALLGLFLLKKFFWYIIIIVLYSTLFGGRLWHTI